MMLLNVVNTYEIREKRDRKFDWTGYDIFFSQDILTLRIYGYFMLNRGQNTYEISPFLSLFLFFTDSQADSMIEFSGDMRAYVKRIYKDTNVCVVIYTYIYIYDYTHTHTHIYT